MAVHRTQSEPVQLVSKGSGTFGLKARKGLAGTVDKIFRSARPGKINQQQDGIQPSLVVGPVIGKVTHNSARILIEINSSALVTVVLEPDNVEDTRESFQSIRSWSSMFRLGSHQIKTRQPSIPENQVAELEKPEQRSVEKSLQGGRPGVFHFTNLKPATRYRIRFKGCTSSVSGSFRTLDISNASQALNFGVISCNNVCITQRAIPIHSDLWEQLYKHITSGKVNYLLHLGDQIYADVEPAVERELDRFQTAKSLLHGLPPEQWEQHKETVCELYRQVYRDTWQHAPTAKCLANCPSLMILDDHEIRDNWGDLPEDWNRDSMEFFIARCGWIVYLEYQRQLHEDVDFSSLQDVHKEYHFHVLGGVGLMFIDIRGSRTFHRIEGDQSPYLGSQQWKDITDSLFSPGGIFNGVTALLLCATAPLVFLEPAITNVAAKNVNRLEDFKGHWSAHPHRDEQIQMIDTLTQWKGGREGREVLALGGDVHCGGHSDVLKDNKVVFQQLTSSAIANTSLPKTAYYCMRLVGQLGGSLRPGYSFKHYHWTRSRNYGLVRVKVPKLNQNNGAGAEITSQLVKGKFMRGILLGAKVSSKSKRKRKRTVSCC